MLRVLIIALYLTPFHNCMNHVFLEKTQDSDRDRIVNLVLLPDRFTGQKTKKDCSGVMITSRHFMTSSKCADLVQFSGPHGTLLFENIGRHNHTSDIFDLHWKFHKYFDGAKMERDVAIIEIQDLTQLSTIRTPTGCSSIVSVFCSSCFGNCYTFGWKTDKNGEKTELQKTRINIISEESSTGTSTNIFAQKFNKSLEMTLNLGSPLMCHQYIGQDVYSAVVGVLIDESYDSKVIKFRSFRGLLTWISNWAMGVQVSSSGHLGDAKVCMHTDCDETDDQRRTFRKSVLKNDSKLAHNRSFQIVLLLLLIVL